MSDFYCYQHAQLYKKDKIEARHKFVGRVRAQWLEVTANGTVFAQWFFDGATYEEVEAIADAINAPFKRMAAERKEAAE